MARNELGRFLPGTSGNAGGRPKPPDGLRTRMAELSPRAVERLGELLDSDDERFASRRPRRSSIAPGPSANPGRHQPPSRIGDQHIAALLEVARRRALEPITLED